jgi:hypothetical protein
VRLVCYPLIGPFVISSFLRLKRTKIGLEDFKTVKVIGKGAFGEVSLVIPGRSCETIEADDYSLGPIVPKGGHGQDLRHEDIIQKRNVQKGPGAYIQLDFSCRRS